MIERPPYNVYIVRIVEFGAIFDAECPDLDSAEKQARIEREKRSPKAKIYVIRKTVKEKAILAL